MSTEASPQPQDGAAPPAAGAKASLPLVIAIVAGLAVGGASGAFVVGPALANGIAPASGTAAVHAGEAAGGGASGHAASGGGDAEHGGNAGHAPPMYALDDLVLNPAASNGSRLLLFAVAVELADSAAATRMKERDAQARDAVLDVLGAKTTEQLADLAGRDAMKQELLERISVVLDRKGAVRRLYFPQFVLQ